MTNAQLVSRIVNDSNALAKDDHISRRYILNIARTVSEFFISQKLADRSLYREDNLFKSVDCFKLESIDVTRCDIIEFRNCNSVMKSVKKLPKLIYSKYGNSLKEVTSIDNNIDFKYTTPRQWRKDKDRPGTTKNVMFYVKDDYLYLLDTEIEMVNLYLLTLETEKLEDISDCEEKSCKSLWEYEFIYPSKLITPIIDETVRKVFGKKSITSDTNPNLDNNQKGKTSA